MAVMYVLAAAHIGFWTWGLVLGLQSGALHPSHGVALAAWLALVGMWLVVVGRLSRSGWLSGPGLATQPWLWLPSPPVMLPVFAVLGFPLLTQAWLGSLAPLPAYAVPALNGLRVLAIGTAFKSWRGQLPRRIGYGVGIPDFLFGLWSIAIAARGGFADSDPALAWHLIGATIMMAMLPMVFTVLRPPRLDSPETGNARAILAFPLVLAPAGLASLFVVLHLMSLYASFGNLLGGLVAATPSGLR